MSRSAPPPLEPETDDALLRRAQAGDLGAFAAFYGRYERVVYGFFVLRLGRRRLHAWEDADDLAGEVWVRVWAKRAQYAARAGSTPKDWLFTIALNLWRDWLRRRSNRQPADPLEPWVHFEHGWSPTPAALLVDPPDSTAAQLRDEVRAAVDSLTPAQRQVIRFRWLYDQSLPDAVRRLGLPKDAIMQRQIRAFVRLRAALAAYDPALG